MSICVQFIPAAGSGQGAAVYSDTGTVGYLVRPIDTTSAPCGAYVLYTNQEINDLSAIGITAESVAISFGWGFGAVVLFWSLGYIGAIARKAIAQM